MSAATANFDGNQLTSCERGIDFSVTLGLKDEASAFLNLASYTAKMQVRPLPEGDIIVELSTENGRITIVPNKGTVKLFIPASITETLPPGNYLYDIKLTSSNGNLIRLLQGSFLIVDEITE